MLLKRLTEASGLPGMEGEVRDLIREEIKGLVDEIRTDALGNLIAFKKGTKTGPTVMLAAHMDEVGLMVTFLQKNGLLRCKPLGGVDPRVLVSKKVVIGKNRVPGVIGSKPIHLQTPDERKTAIPLDKLYIDIGAKSKEEAEKLVEIGDPILFDTQYAEVGEGCAKAKAFDDRIGCAVIIDILKRNPELPVYAVFTVQEEVGLRGASVAAHDLDVDFAMVFEGTTASDVPNMSERHYSTGLGEGPAISLMDAGMIANRKMVQELIDVAQENRLPYQFRRTAFGGTDAGRIHLTKEGIPACVLSVPTRYIHSPVSLIKLNDYHTLIELVDKYLQKIVKGGSEK